MYRRFYIFGNGTILLIAIALSTVSCSSGKPKLELVPVRGKVLFKDKPAGGVNLVFLPATGGDSKVPRPHASTSEDGSFVVMTDEEEGAPVGEYVVTMTWLHDPGVPDVKKGEPISMTMAHDPVDKLGGKYNDLKKGVKVKVEKGVSELPPIKLN